MATPDKQPAASSVQMLTVTGEAALTEAFFQRIQEVVAASVRETFAEFGKELTSARAPAPSTQLAGSAMPESGMELAHDQPKQAGNLRRGTGVNLALKEGQGMIDARTLASFLDISDRALYRLIATGSVLKPIKVGGRIKRWLLEEVLAWIHDGCPSEEKWDRVKKLAIRDYRTWSTAPKK